MVFGLGRLVKDFRCSNYKLIKSQPHPINILYPSVLVVEIHIFEKLLMNILLLYLFTCVGKFMSI